MLGHALAKHGVETALIPLYDQAVDVPLLGLDGLIINYARPVNLELVRGYKDSGLPVWVLDTEGGVLADDGANSPQRLATYIRDSGYSKLLAGYFFWGGTLHEAFVRHSGMDVRQLHLTGCPRFDFAATRWRGLLKHDRKGYILINANFTLVNPLFAKSPEEELRTLIAAGWKEDYIEKLVADSKQILANFIDAVNRLASRFPERQFMLRPHPFENAERYRTAFVDTDNVEVDGLGSVLNVIQNSECVLHLNCGTSIEAIMLDKLPLAMEFLNTPHMSQHSTLPSRVSLRADTEQQLYEYISDIPGASRRFDFGSRYREQIHPWFYLNDGFAADRVAGALIASLDKRGATGSRSSIRRSLASSRRVSRTSQRAQAVIANLFGSRLTGQLRATLQPKRAAKQLHRMDIANVLGSLALHEGVGTRRVDLARHPMTGMPLSSVLIRPE